MPNINKVLIAGRITADAELKTTPSGLPVCSFSVAVNRRVSKGSENITDFFNCTAWRTTAEFVSKHFKKGDSIFVCGSLQTRSWTDKQGNKRYETEIVADDVDFGSSKPSSGAEQTAPEHSNNAYVPDAYKEPKATQMEGFKEVGNGTDEGLPF